METLTLSRKELHRPGLLKAACDGRITKYRTTLNLKTAKALGLDVPATVLARVDELIELPTSRTTGTARTFRGQRQGAGEGLGPPKTLAPLRAVPRASLDGSLLFVFYSPPNYSPPNFTSKSSVAWTSPKVTRNLPRV